jgi:RNA 2',3'-cyclic 3'-phosphodiesterase
VSTRTFIAVELASPLIQALTRRIQYLRSVSPSVRWVDPASLHLTLTFLGDLDDAQLASATKAALTSAARSRPFRLAIGNLGFFGPPARPTVVWAGVTGDLNRLHQLQDDLTREQSRHNLPDQDHYSFSPHLTLARLSRSAGRSAAEPDEVSRLLAAIASSQQPRTQSAMLVEQISVMKSQLARPHAIYTRLAACPLLGGAG